MYTIKVMAIIFSILLGYLLGTLNPAAWLSRRKHTDLRSQGTGNLGATNTLLVLGKRYGAFVMLFDIMKAVIAVRLSQKLFPSLEVAGLLAGTSAVVGHVFPYYLNFKGGKGLAAFAGLVLGVDSKLFLLLALISIVLMLIINYSVAMPMSAGILFPILYGLQTGSITAFLIASAASILIICKHYSNIAKAKNDEDIKIRDYIKDTLFR